MSKQLPKRAGSRAQYVFWIVFAIFMTAWGMTQFIRPDGDQFWGAVAIVGFIGMAMRETSLRRKWKAQNGNANA